jgi:hypothetical protein
VVSHRKTVAAPLPVTFLIEMERKVVQATALLVSELELALVDRPNERVEGQSVLAHRDVVGD